MQVDLTGNIKAIVLPEGVEDVDLTRRKDGQYFLWYSTMQFNNTIKFHTPMRVGNQQKVSILGVIEGGEIPDSLHKEIFHPIEFLLSDKGIDYKNKCIVIIKTE